MTASAASGFARVEAVLLHPFLRPVEAQTLRGRIAICRVLVGLGLAHRYLDIMGFAALAPDPRAHGLQAAVGAALAACVSVGFLTPLALVGLMAFDLAAARFGFTLGLQVHAILAWGLLFFGAGRAWSVDAALARLPGLGRGVRALYMCAVAEDAESCARVRCILAWLFWGVTFSAMTPHLFDRFWINGEVLQLMSASPFWIRRFDVMVAFRDAAPLLYDGFLTLALYVQAFWEFLFFPLLFSRWTRAFAIGQGWGFFIVSLVFLPLGYLPYAELCLWYLLFWPTRAAPEADGRAAGFAAPAPALAHRTVRAFAAASVAVVALQAVVNLPPPLQPSWAPRLLTPGWRHLYWTFGQWQVNVFNRTDLGMGSVYAVLVETDADGEPLRVVPYRDRHGGRLDYMRNDFLLYGLAAPMVRVPPEEKFVGADTGRPAPLYEAYLRRLGLLDACVTRTAGTRHYAAYIFAKQLVDTDRFTVWSETTPAATLAWTVTPLEVGRITSQWPLHFDLAPGHAGTGARAADSLAYVRTSPGAPPPPAHGAP